MADPKRISDLTISELTDLIESVVRKVVREEQATGNGSTPPVAAATGGPYPTESAGRESDPDAGRDLQPKVAAYLKKSLRETRDGKRGISMEKVAAELDLRWPGTRSNVDEEVVFLPIRDQLRSGARRKR